MIAVIETGGKQYLVSVGGKVQVEKIEGVKGDKVTFDKVLFTAEGAKYQVGKPYISGAAVEATITKQGRGKKIEILKYKAKSKYRRKAGHRQSYTEVEITKV
jgi:large subunit ribosomal protein L21